MIKIVQQLLLYKEDRLCLVKTIYIGQYALFILSIMSFPFFWASDYIVMLVWLIIQVLLEMLQIKNSDKCSLIDYLTSFWNVIDLLRIVSMALYVAFTILARDQVTCFTP
jgi:hypothetical protein